jgi:protein-L-isoaspartate(D-aspartate) O-methyltransferase
MISKVLTLSLLSVSVAAHTMAEMEDLLKRLRKAGLPLTDSIREAMMNVDIQNFTDYDPLPFWHDRPIVFTETERGGVKTISAPHMVVTLLHHLELSAGQEVLILGAKGGYLAALVSHIVGPEGGVTVVDPNRQVVEHVRKRLKQQKLNSPFTVRKMHALERAPPNLPDPLNRVLVTGSLAALPRWLEERVCEGGFVIAPLGGRVSQRLVKRERQQEMVDTDLGGVLFGPVDICETEHELAGPAQLAELFEDALEVGGELGIFADDILDQLGMLVTELRELPDTLAPLDLYTEGEPEIVLEEDAQDFIFELEGMGLDDDHPIFQILANAAEWLTPLWPTLLALFETQMQHPGAPDVDVDEDGRDFGPHGDLVP